MRHAVTECYQPHWFLTGDSRFPVIHVCADTEQKPIMLLLFFFSPPTSFFLLLHSSSLVLFFCLPLSSCLLIVVVPHQLFLLQKSLASSTATQGLCFKTSGTLKKCSNTPSSTCGVVQPNRGFQHADDGAHSSFLNPRKSVDGLCPVV